MFYGKHEMKTGLRKRYIVLIAILSLIAVMVIGFLGWTAFFYKADDTARAFLTSDTTLQEKGNLTILPEAGSAADEVMQAYPDIRIWYMSGHSLGGAMAGRYAGRHADRIRGLTGVRYAYALWFPGYLSQRQDHLYGKCYMH
jgi:pimeloyl-ACP methyl ester carboxylesterase